MLAGLSHPVHVDLPRPGIKPVSLHWPGRALDVDHYGVPKGLSDLAWDSEGVALQPCEAPRSGHLYL